MTMITCVPTVDFLDRMHMQTNIGYWLEPTIPWPDAERVMNLIFSLSESHERTNKLEDNSKILQLIPYLAIKTSDDKFLFYRRKGQENRLHGSLSIGFGGHVLLDTTSFESFEKSIYSEMRREIEEEISKEIADEAVGNAKLIAILYNDENQVSSVHLGLGYLAELDKTAEQLQGLHSIECGKIQAATLSEIVGDSMELWTASLIDAIAYSEQLDTVVKLAGRTFTGWRRPNTDEAFLCPERDMGAQALQVLSSIIETDAQNLWPQLADIMQLGEYPSQLSFDVYRSIAKLLSLAEQPDSDETANYIGALKASGFFSIPHNLRGYCCALLGLGMLPHMWLSIRQYSYASHDAAEQYAKMNDEAGNALRLLLGRQDEKTFITNNIKRYLSEGKISKAELMRLVEETEGVS